MKRDSYWSMVYTSSLVPVTGSVYAYPPKCWTDAVAPFVHRPIPVYTELVHTKLR